MAFENLTLFELHLENSRIGPDFGGEGAAEEEMAAESESEESSGGGLGRIVGTLVLLAIVAMAVRRFRSSGEETGPEGETDQITIEHAAEQ